MQSYFDNYHILCIFYLKYYKMSQPQTFNFLGQWGYIFEKENKTKKKKHNHLL